MMKNVTCLSPPPPPHPYPPPSTRHISMQVTPFTASPSPCHSHPTLLHPHLHTLPCPPHLHSYHHPPHFPYHSTSTLMPSVPSPSTFHPHSLYPSLFSFYIHISFHVQELHFVLSPSTCAHLYPHTCIFLNQVYVPLYLNHFLGGEKEKEGGLSKISKDNYPLSLLLQIRCKEKMKLNSILPNSSTSSFSTHHPHIPPSIHPSPVLSYPSLNATHLSSTPPHASFHPPSSASSLHTPSTLFQPPCSHHHP